MSGVGVLTVHPDDEARRAVRSVVTSTQGFEALGDVATAEESLDLVMALRPMLALVAVTMPGIDGFETSRRLVRARPETTVVLLYTSAEPQARVVAESRAVAAVASDALTPAVLQTLWEEHGRR